MTDFRPLYKALNDLVDEMVDMRETVALLEKQIIAKVAPLPIETAKKPRKPRTARKKDSLLVAPAETPDDKSQVTSCAGDEQKASQTAQALFPSAQTL